MVQQLTLPTDNLGGRKVKRKPTAGIGIGGLKVKRRSRGWRLEFDGVSIDLTGDESQNGAIVIDAPPSVRVEYLAATQ